MWKIRAILVAALFFVVFGGFPCWATPYVVVDQSGFSPAAVSLYESSYDSFTANLFTSTSHVEIPSGECTYEWSIYKVYRDIDGDYSDTWVDATAGNGTIFSATLTDYTSQTCTLEMEVFEGGYWFIDVDVTVTYPDGYAKVFRKHVAMHGSLELAGDAVQKPGLA